MKKNEFELGVAERCGMFHVLFKGSEFLIAAGRLTSYDFLSIVPLAGL
jgi:hypothetical protein